MIKIFVSARIKICYTSYQVIPTLNLVSTMVRYTKVRFYPSRNARMTSCVLRLFLPCPCPVRPWPKEVLYSILVEKFLIEPEPSSTHQQRMKWKDCPCISSSVLLYVMRLRIFARQKRLSNLPSFNSLRQPYKLQQTIIMSLNCWLTKQQGRRSFVLTRIVH